MLLACYIGPLSTNTFPFIIICTNTPRHETYIFARCLVLISEIRSIGRADIPKIVRAHSVELKQVHGTVHLIATHLRCAINILPPQPQWTLHRRLQCWCRYNLPINRLLATSFSANNSHKHHQHSSTPQQKKNRVSSFTHMAFAKFLKYRYNMA